MVTVKLPRNPAHNPRDKVSGLCPVGGAYCTDTTGEHHTVLREGTLAEVESMFTGKHITRIEAV